MDLTTFLDLPLDRELYKPKKTLKCEKPPIRVLVTEAGTKAAYHLMYKICSGQVFGPDQPVVLHLVNAKGCLNHKATLLDLEECGFPALIESVVSSEPEISYRDVDVIVLISLFEELSGHNIFNSFLYHLNKARNVVRNMRLYSKPDAKLVVCSPSTKGALILLTCIKLFEPRIVTKNATAVVFLDEIIAKNLLAAQLKTTTDKIKNVTIWGATAPDLHNATVFTHPPEDRGSSEKVELPVIRILENQKWIYSDFVPSLYKRVPSSELVQQGGAVASAAAKHLRVLFQERQEEIASMGVITPPEEPYGLPQNMGFSLPVSPGKGSVSIREDVNYNITTHIMNLRTVYDHQSDTTMQTIYDMVNYMLEYERLTRKRFFWNQHVYLGERYLALGQNLFKHFMTRIHDKSSDDDDDVKDVTTKKSITWEVQTSDNHCKNIKSVLRFNIQDKNYL